MYEVVFYPRKKSLVTSLTSEKFRRLKACESFLFEHIEYCKRDFLGYYKKDYKPFSSAIIYEVKRGKQKRLVRNIVFWDKSDIIEEVAI